MNNTEAIHILTSIKNTPTITWENGADIAFDLAIKALEEQPTGDLISREELKKHKFVIPDIQFTGGRRNGKTIERITLAYNKGWNAAIDAIYENAPAVEQPTNEWGKWVISEIKCPNCLEYFQTDCYSMEELKKCPNCRADMEGDNK